MASVGGWYCTREALFQTTFVRNQHLFRAAVCRCGTAAARGLPHLARCVTLTSPAHGLTCAFGLRYVAPLMADCWQFELQ